MATLADDLERWALRLAAGVLVALLLVASTFPTNASALAWSKVVLSMVCVM
jgi:hypothetical protein